MVVCTGRVEALRVPVGQGAFFSGVGTEDWMQRRRIDKGMNQSDTCSHACGNRHDNKLE